MLGRRGKPVHSNSFYKHTSTQAHTHLTGTPHIHTQNSSTPTLTPAREEITNAIAESKQLRRQEHGAWNPGKLERDTGCPVFPWATYSTLLSLTLFSCKNNC